MEEQKDPLEGLTDKQKEDTMNLMQIAGIDQVSIARQFMEMSNFDVQLAVSCYYETGQQHGSGQGNVQQQQHQAEQDHYEPPQQMFNDDQHAYQPENHIVQQLMNHVQQQQQQQQQVIQGVDQEQLQRYKQFIENKKVLEENNGVVKKVVSGLGSATKSVWNSIMPVAFRGETPGGEEFNQFLYKQLKIKESYDFQNGRFQECLDRAYTQKKPMVVFIYHDSSPSRDLQIKLLKDDKLIKELNKSFFVLGILSTSEETDKIQKYVKSDQWPAFVYFRKDIFERNKLIETVTIKNSIQESDYYVTKAKEARSKFYMTLSEENKIVKAQQVSQRPQINPFLMDEMNFIQQQQMQQQQNDPETIRREQERKQRIEQERLLKLQQEQEYQEMLKQSEEQERLKREEEKRKEEEEIQKVIKQQMYEEEIKKKKQILSQEPAADQEGIITINFRLPDATQIKRRFLLTDKPELLFIFIETNDDVTFEHENGKQNFDLIQTFPQMSLKQKIEQENDKTLAEIFDDSDYEQLHVREL